MPNYCFLSTVLQYSESRSTHAGSQFLEQPLLCNSLHDPKRVLGHKHCQDHIKSSTKEKRKLSVSHTYMYIEQEIYTVDVLVSKVSVIQTLSVSRVLEVLSLSYLLSYKEISSLMFYM